eukprot:1034599-Rhodomonas_salina.1
MGEIRPKRGETDPCSTRNSAKALDSTTVFPETCRSTIHAHTLAQYRSPPSTLAIPPNVSDSGNSVDGVGYSWEIIGDSEKLAGDWRREIAG